MTPHGERAIRPAFQDDQPIRRGHGEENGISTQPAGLPPSRSNPLEPTGKVPDMSDMRAQIVKFVPRPLRGMLFEVARRLRTDVFGIPDPYGDMARLNPALAAAGVLDIGAHVGETAKSLRKAFPDTPLFCFEPTTESYAKLGQNLASCPDVHLYQLALGDNDGQASFFVNANAQTNSLLDNGTDNVRFVGEATRHLGMVTVPVRTLDTWFSESDLKPDARLVLKADVQGGEALLIAGGRKVFSRNVVAFYTEVGIASLYTRQASLRELLATLEKLGFVPYQFYRTRSTASGRALWFDAMWVNAKLVQLDD